MEARQLQLGAWGHITGLKQTIRFAGDPAKYIRDECHAHRLPYKSTVLGYDVVIVTAFDGVKELLEAPERFSHREAYHDMFAHSFGENVMLRDDPEYLTFFNSLFKEVVTTDIHELVMGAQNVLDEAFDRLRDDIASSMQLPYSIELYQVSKSVFSEFLIAMFLGLTHHDQPEFKEYQHASVVSFRGASSIPLKLGRIGLQTNHSKGLAAVSKMKEIVRERIENFPSAETICGRLHYKVHDSDDYDEALDHAVDQVVMFTCGIASKAFASLFSSAIYALFDNPEWIDIIMGQDLSSYALIQENHELHIFLQECERLYPPILGGCRGISCDNDDVLQDHMIPSHCKIWYSTLSANTDPSMFEEPEIFNPLRWNRAESKENIDAHASFGMGPRGCLGRSLSESGLKLYLVKFLQNFEIVRIEEECVWKHIPVRRTITSNQVWLTPRRKERSASEDDKSLI